MIRTKVHADLPSELPPAPGAVKKLVEWLLGKQEEDEDEELDEQLQEVLIDNLTIFEGFIGALGDAGFDDVLSVVVDGKPVYVDPDERVGDLNDALEGTVKCGALKEGLQVLRATFSRHIEGLHVLAELRVKARVPEGEEEASILLSARVDALAARPEDGPREFAARVREYVQDSAKLSADRDRVAALAQGLVDSTNKRFPHSEVKADETEVLVIAPGPKQVGRMRHLGFKGSFRSPTYNALPTYERSGAYDDPHNTYRYSPYHDLMSWIALGELLSGHWAQTWVKIVHPTGPLLCTGDRAKGMDPARLEVPRDVVRVSPEGQVTVDDSIPEVAPLDPAETGSPHAPGWGGEAWDEDG